MDFQDMGSFAAHIAARAAAFNAIAHTGLEKAARLVEKSAKDELGNYQSAIGTFVAWDELADSTKEHRVALGYTENDPGLMSGAMRESIGHKVSELDALIGSDDDHLVYFEFGTKKQPPRPVLGPAAYKNKDKIQKILGAATVAGIIGGDQVHAALGYDMDIK